MPDCQFIDMMVMIMGGLGLAGRLVPLARQDNLEEIAGLLWLCVSLRLALLGAFCGESLSTAYLLITSGVFYLWTLFVLGLSLVEDNAERNDPIRASATKRSPR